MHHKETLETRKERKNRERKSRSRKAERHSLCSASFKSCLFNNRGFLFLNLSLSYSLETLVYTHHEEFKGEREGF